MRLCNIDKTGFWDIKLRDSKRWSNRTVLSLIRECLTDGIQFSYSILPFPEHFQSCLLFPGQMESYILTLFLLNLSLSRTLLHLTFSGKIFIFNLTFPASGFILDLIFFHFQCYSSGDTLNITFFLGRDIFNLIISRAALLYPRIPTGRAAGQSGGQLNASLHIIYFIINILAITGTLNFK